MSNENKYPDIGRIRHGRKVFTTKEVAMILEVGEERFKQWLKQDYLNPTFKASGSGTRHLFDTIDLIRCGLFKKLVESGLSRWISKQFVNEFSGEEIYNIGTGHGVEYLICTGNPVDRKKWKDSMQLLVASALENIEKHKNNELIIIINMRKIGRDILDSVA